jgi:hypothetical protein
MINKATGALTDIARVTNSAGGGGIDDMEGLSFTPDGVLYGTTGDSSGSPNDNSLWKINNTTAVATLVRAFPSYSDYEAVAFLEGETTPNEIIPPTCTSPVETELAGSIGDYVWDDADSDGEQDAGEDGLPDITVWLYEDENGNGIIDPEDDLLDTASTDSNGNYDFTGLASGSYIVDVDENDPDLPSGATLTTDDPLSVALSVGQDYNDADFGFDPPPTAVGLSSFVARSVSTVPASQGVFSLWRWLGVACFLAPAIGGLTCMKGRLDSAKTRKQR